MSESIAIPKRKKHVSSRNSSNASPSPTNEQTPSSSFIISVGNDSAASSPESFGTRAKSASAKGKGKEVVRSESEWRSTRRTSLLGSSLSKSEYTVINIGDPDGVPRLITCVKASQGFDWNQEIFLPSYMSDFHSYQHTSGGDLERRQDPVEDIILTEEEAMGFFPV